MKTTNFVKIRESDITDKMVLQILKTGKYNTKRIPKESD